VSLNINERTVVDNQDSETECAGLKPFEDCATAKQLLAMSQDFKPDRHLWAADRYAHYVTLAYLQLGCVACGHICTVSVEMQERAQTGKARVICESSDKNSYV
jgi:hypothetical protein